MQAVESLQSRPAAPADALTLRGGREFLRRRKPLFFYSALTGLAIGVLVVGLSRPRYSATARMLLENAPQTIARYDAANPLSGLMGPDSAHALDTQIEMLASDQVLAEAFRKGGVPPSEAQLQISQVEATDVVEITAEAPTAAAAETLAREIPRSFLRHYRAARQTRLRGALLYLQSRLAGEQETLRDAEGRLAQFRAALGLSGDLKEELGPRIHAAYAAAGQARQAEAEAAAARANLDSLIAARRAMPDVAETPAQGTNPARQEAREQIAVLRTERAKRLVLFKPSHPNIQQMDARIADLEERLRALPETVTTTTRTLNPTAREYDARIRRARDTLADAQARVAPARAQAERLAADLDRLNAQQLRQARLQRAVDRHRDAVALLSGSVTLLSLRRIAEHPPARIISPAGTAAQADPRRLRTLLYAAAVGLFVGLCLALLSERLDDRVTPGGAAPRRRVAPVGGFSPRFWAGHARLLNRPATRAGLLESYRMLRANVQFATVDAPTNSLVVTSTSPGEGKSATALNLAMAMAMDGQQVILVDADLRRPSLHRKLGIERSPGLTSVLAGRLSLDEALRTTGVAGLLVLTAGPRPPNPAEMLNSGAMQRLQAHLREQADVVIFDGPPCMAMADTPTLAAGADGVIYVVQCGRARRDAMLFAAGQLRHSRARVLGIVFNKVEPSDDLSGVYNYPFYRSGPLDARAARRGQLAAPAQAPDTADDTGTV